MILQWLKELFCRHRFFLVDPESFPSPEEGEGKMYIREHECYKCGQKRMISSGWMF